MAMYADQPMEQDISDDDIKSMMVAKATELFTLCDREQKGFITKRDMQRLQTELPLSPEQLEDVFDSLDDDGNGFLTLEEFTEGFGSFLGITQASVAKHASLDSSAGSTSERVYENEHGFSDDDEDHLNQVVDDLGAHGVVEDVDIIKELWGKLRRDEPELLGTFEDFLSKVTGQLRKKHADYQNLESALRTKSSAHDEEVRRLYDEMELQIRLEKERVLNEEKAKERQLKDDLERELEEKDRQLQEIMTRHQEVEKKLEELNTHESETKQENEALMRERLDLELMLDDSQQELEESRAYVNQLRQQQREEKRERALAALQISEGIALERESLVKQLDMLRDMNKKLRDDRDEVELKRGNLELELNEAYGETANYSYPDESIEQEGEEDKENSPALQRGGSSRSSARSNASVRNKRQLTKQGSILSSYFSSTPNSRQNSLVPDLTAPEEDDIEVDEISGLGSSYYGIPAAMATESLAAPVGSADVVDSAIIPQTMSTSTLTPSSTEDRGVVHEMLIEPGLEHLSTAARGQPVGANSSPEIRETASLVQEDLESASPGRLFKIVFVGDSGVGKSSFIHRFCNNSFKSTFSATIGVDFQVKNIRVDDQVIALQLWDTAGQERFRSITKQYFRKADGVLIMYDVTSEASYKNVANWMVSVQEGTEENTVLLLAGNKMDLVEDEDARVVKTKDGARLADEYGALFYETSALSGLCVHECMEAMASLLREHEDKEMEKAMQLSEETAKKRGCCS